MTNLNNFSNKSFGRAVQRIRKIMPALAFTLLFIVYAVSAIAAGILLSGLMEGLKFGVALAYAIGISIQATRALLVFFPQLNPSRPVFGFTGEIIAVVMGLVSIAEIVGLVVSSGLLIPVAVSLSILMLAGIGIELFLLREIRFATEMQLFSNRSYWDELKQFYQARKQFQVMLDDLEDESPQTAIPNEVFQGNGQEVPATPL